MQMIADTKYIHQSVELCPWRKSGCLTCPIINCLYLYLKKMDSMIIELSHIFSEDGIINIIPLHLHYYMGIIWGGRWQNFGLIPAIVLWFQLKCRLQLSLFGIATARLLSQLESRSACIQHPHCLPLLASSILFMCNNFPIFSTFPFV